MSTFDGQSRRARLRVIIFDSDTPAGKLFDLVLIVFICLSVVVVMIESISGIADRWRPELYVLEWIFTVAFTIEYVLRVYSAEQPRRYVRSFFGIVDLLAVLPTYISIFVPGAQSLLVVRFLRLLRVFRVLKLAEYVQEARVLRSALVASRRKILVFFVAVVTLVVIIGAVMHLVEGETNGFTSIPRSVYWAIVTLTTVGFGDIAPRTPLGQFLASVVMLMGYSILAVPTGIVTAEMTRAQLRQDSRGCPACGLEDHEPDARYCRHCGAAL